MAENQYNSKIVLSSGEVLMDLTQDTVVADKLLKGFTAHGKDGAPITGSCEFDADTGDATAGAAEILTGKTAYVTGSKVTGTMPNNGAKTLNITEKGKPVTIPQGYAEDFKRALREVEPELSDVLVPNCVYRCGCPEMDCCGEWQRMCRETNQSIDAGSIKYRYRCYNDLFYGTE